MRDMIIHFGNRSGSILDLDIHNMGNQQKENILLTKTIKYADKWNILVRFLCFYIKIQLLRKLESESSQSFQKSINKRKYVDNRILLYSAIFVDNMDDYSIQVITKNAN